MGREAWSRVRGPNKFGTMRVEPDRRPQSETAADTGLLDEDTDKASEAANTPLSCETSMRSFDSLTRGADESHEGKRLRLSVVLPNRAVRPTLWPESDRTASVRRSVDGLLELFELPIGY